MSSKKVTIGETINITQEGNVNIPLCQSLIITSNKFNVDGSILLAARLEINNSIEVNNIGTNGERVLIDFSPNTFQGQLHIKQIPILVLGGPVKNPFRLTIIPIRVSE